MITLKSSEEAAEAVNKAARETKSLYSEYYSGRTGNKMHFKPGNIQYTRTYKARSAYYKVSTLMDEEKAKGLTTAPTGNRTQSVAYVAKLTGIKATIVISITTPLIKVGRTKDYDAEVIPAGDVFDEACAEAYGLTDEFGYTFIHPFDGLAIATGQGIIVMGIIKELPTIDYILIPMGGGGLCAGVSTLAKLLNPGAKVIGMESAGTNYMQKSLKAGHVVGSPNTNTIADSTAVKRLGEKIFPYIQENVGDIIITEDSELIVAFLDMVKNHKMIVENSDLLTVAALKHMNVEKRKVVFALSSGNMDAITIASIVQHGLIQRDGVFTVPTLLPDRPDELAEVSVLLAKEQGNVIKLEHNQSININRDMAVGLCIIIGAYGMEHKNAIVRALNDAGYHLKLVKSKGTYTEQDETIQKTTIVTSKNTQARYHRPQF